MVHERAARRALELAGADYADDHVARLVRRVESMLGPAWALYRLRDAADALTPS
jgi:hypothetical protein